MSILPSPVHMMGRLFDGMETYRKSRSGAPPSSTQVFTGRLFDVDPEMGFFPSQPYRRLPGEFELWEHELENARSVLKLGEDRGSDAFSKCAKGEEWRQRLRSWPLLDVRNLGNGIRVLRRAHYVLTCLLHFYVHSLPPYQAKDRVVIPKPLSIPLVQVSQTIDLPPVLTFADITEENFYLLSAAAELKGVEMLRVFEKILNMPYCTDRVGIATLTREFEKLVRIIDELAAILKNASKTVDPNIFYWMARPWWNGSDAAAPWVFEGVPSDTPFDLGGASAGQSSVMHALDAFLDIDHALNQARQPAPSAENRETAAAGFMEKMRRYMPVEHRAYLVQLQKRNIRDTMARHSELKGPYNAAVEALKAFRSAHIRTGTLFVISQANSSRPECMGTPDFSAQAKADRSRGTGGNPVATLLKGGRDATARAILN
ncbi:Indoleamine 2,3-dioxygenase [Epithele typhae]|uniref:Indoleamine 2,3-dioxygenase n=1 Tax=Epithele typhae TaxID=378194 RepID=UPI0020083920|nr:Indoleamine 2,3-dioxygenase [Epithele typhae]KAH9945845.1 Indoleamine 2,3-dioxygenase [Epithele typhae]